jgi:hypothetical protein
MIPKHDPKGWATRSADYKKIRAELLAAETSLLGS